MRSAAGLTLPGLALAATGCGGDDSSAEAQARAVVADYVDAILDRDAAAACDALTSDGQDQVAAAVGKVPNQPRAESCDEALTNLIGDLQPVDPDAPVPAVERIRSGDDPVTVSITGDTGVVIAAPGPRGTRVPVEQVDHEWLVRNGTDPLFPFGVDPVR
jgi:hypothetical protein